MAPATAQSIAASASANQAAERAAACGSRIVCDLSAWRSRARSKRMSLFDGSSTSGRRSEEHTSELQSLMRISYAVFCLKKKKKHRKQHTKHKPLLCQI